MASVRGTHAAKYRNRTDQRSGKKQWFGVAPGLNFVISVQGNDLVRLVYLAAGRGTRGKRFIGYFVSGCFPLLFFCIFVIEFGAIR